MMTTPTDSTQNCPGCGNRWDDSEPIDEQVPSGRIDWTEEHIGYRHSCDACDASYVETTEESGHWVDDDDNDATCEHCGDRPRHPDVSTPDTRCCMTCHIENELEKDGAR